MSKPTQKKKKKVESPDAPAGKESHQENREKAPPAEKSPKGSSSPGKKAKKGKKGAQKPPKKTGSKTDSAQKGSKPAKAKSRPKKGVVSSGEEKSGGKDKKKASRKAPVSAGEKDPSPPSAAPADRSGQEARQGGAEKKSLPAGGEGRRADRVLEEPEGFTQGLSVRTLKVLEAARAIQDRLGHGAVTTGHLIAAILEEEAGIARDVFWDINAYPDMFVEEMARIKEIPPPKTGWWFDETTELVVERAKDGAEALGSRETEPEHLVLALLSLAEGHAAEILEEFSMDREDLKAEILAHMGIPVEECPDWEHETKREKSRRIRKQKAKK